LGAKRDGCHEKQKERGGKGFHHFGKEQLRICADSQRDFALAQDFADGIRKGATMQKFSIFHRVLFCGNPRLDHDQPMTVVRTGIAVALFSAAIASAGESSGVRAEYDQNTGVARITESGKPIFDYHYRTVEIPKGFFEGISGNHLKYTQKYARPRSDYIHPLYGPDGQELTSDWNKDHPHHRGIYWAWPEVQFNGETGDLHALQRVWARPTGKIETRSGKDWAEIEAQSRWMWEDKVPIVRETAKIRAWKSGKQGRWIDLTLRFEALKDGVTLARRATKKYGGLNIRLAPVRDMKLLHHADPAEASPRMAWQAAAGVWPGSDHPLTMVVFEKTSNPEYPADYEEYPKLPWFQPTFPKAGERFALVKGKPLVLRYRIWIRSGPPPSDDEFRAQWKRYNPNHNKP
jgi:hypothetical protein